MIYRFIAFICSCYDFIRFKVFYFVLFLLVLFAYFHNTPLHFRVPSFFFTYVTFRKGYILSMLISSLFHKTSSFFTFRIKITNTDVDISNVTEVGIIFFLFRGNFPYFYRMAFQRIKIF